MDKILGREPVLWTTLFAMLLQLASAWVLPLTVERQSLLNATFALVLGAVAAALVSAERAVPLLVGVLQAVIQVAVGFGLQLSPETQTALLAAAAAMVAFWTRGQVVSPVPPPRELVMLQPDAAGVYRPEAAQ
jgi:hypothetical protein